MELRYCELRGILNSVTTLYQRYQSRFHRFICCVRKVLTGDGPRHERERRGRQGEVRPQPWDQGTGKGTKEASEPKRR